MGNNMNNMQIKYICFNYYFSFAAATPADGKQHEQHADAKYEPDADVQQPEPDGIQQHEQQHEQHDEQQPDEQHGHDEQHGNEQPRYAVKMWL